MALKYYRSRIAGLSVVVGPAPEGELAPETVRFKPVHQRWDGDMERFGYLKTKNDVAQTILDGDGNVEEIDKDEYDTVMKKAKDESVTSVFFGTL